MQSARNHKLEKAIILLTRLPRAVRKSTEREIFKPLLHSIDKSLSPHHMVIMKTVEEEGKLHISKIGDTLMISKAQMTHSIDRLIRLGMLKRSPDPKDRRKTDIVLTPKGKKSLATFDTAIKKHIVKTLDWLDDEGLERLLDSIKFVIKTIEKF